MLVTADGTVFVFESSNGAVFVCEVTDAEQGAVVLWVFLHLDAIGAGDDTTDCWVTSLIQTLQT